MNANTERTTKSEQGYRRLLRHLRKQKEAENIGKTIDNKTNRDQPK